MNNIDLFSTPIKSIEVENGIYAYQYPNGVININGCKYMYYSMTEAIKLYKKR